jgi:hypothetical protein
MEPGTIFDVATKPFDWQPIQVSSALFVGGAAAILAEKLHWGHALIKNVGYFLILLALVSGAYVSIEWYTSLRQNLRILTTGGTDVAQGTVENFHPMYYEGRKEESFTVSAHTFRYSDHIATTCFNQPAAHGGPIKPGMLLRIEFTDDCILRIKALAP